MGTRSGVFFASLLGIAAQAQPLRGTVEQHSFVGPITGRTVFFNIYLPEGYAAGSERYPVIYHLHGLGGSQGGSHNTTVPRSFETAQTEGVIGPVIVVFPNGYADSWWADSISGHKPAETDVVLQLMPHVDANFRTVPTGGARAVTGFSMGGFGATKFYSKFPEHFAVCVEYDGALLTWAGMQLFQAQAAAEIFGNDEDYFDQFSPWYWTVENETILQDGPPIRMVVGALVDRNRNFRDHLTGLGIPVNYIETACGHDLACLLNVQGVASAAFIAAHLELECPADFNGDGFVNGVDFDGFVQAFEQGSASADFDGDGFLTGEDFDRYVEAFESGC
jgi:enterochelin esterase-like enzyme